MKLSSFERKFQFSASFGPNVNQEICKDVQDLYFGKVHSQKPAQLSVIAMSIEKEAFQAEVMDLSDDAATTGSGQLTPKPGKDRPREVSFQFDTPPLQNGGPKIDKAVVATDNKDDDDPQAHFKENKSSLRARTLKLVVILALPTVVVFAQVRLTEKFRMEYVWLFN